MAARLRLAADLAGWRCWKFSWWVAAARDRVPTINTPKPMLLVAGPFTEHQIARAREAGVGASCWARPYRAEVFAEYFGDGSAFGWKLVYVTEEEPFGTGGAIRHVAVSNLRSGPRRPGAHLQRRRALRADIAGLLSRGGRRRRRLR